VNVKVYLNQRTAGKIGSICCARIVVSIGAITAD
jgi:hypothetical protein